MKTFLLVATTHGLKIYQREANHWVNTHNTLDTEHITSLIAREGIILAGSTNGVYRSDDLGINWVPAIAGLDIHHVRWLAFHPDISDLEFAGTEPAGIFISHDGARTWRTRPEVIHLRDTLHWYLPYSPESGCVRGFAFHGERLFAAVEVGGVLRSDDRGEHWRLLNGKPDEIQNRAVPRSGQVHPDVHSILVHPASPDLVFAPTGGGLYRSMDGGNSWQHIYNCYCRAVWADPDDPEHLILGPADGVDRNGRIESTRDGGTTWLAASDGLHTPWQRHMVERFYQFEDTLFAVLSNGELLAARLHEMAWERVLQDAKDIHAVTIMEV